MTPERLQEIRTRAREHAANRTTTAYDYGDRIDLLAYIDLLHEEIRLGREELVTEKHKQLRASKEHTDEVLRWDDLTTRLRAEIERLRRGQGGAPESPCA